MAEYYLSCMYWARHIICILIWKIPCKLLNRSYDLLLIANIIVKI